MHRCVIRFATIGALVLAGVAVATILAARGMITLMNWLGKTIRRLGSTTPTARLLPINSRQYCNPKKEPPQ